MISTVFTVAGMVTASICSGWAALAAPTPITAESFAYVKSVYSLPLSLDPIQMSDTASLAVGNLIYDGLLRFSPTLALEGALAESWSTSADGRTITFKLRHGARFHDDSDVTAQDVVASLSRALSPQSKVRKLYTSIAGPRGLRALDPQTVQIELRHPFPPFLSILAGATAKILPAKQIKTYNFFEHPVGSGPFRLVQWQKRAQPKITLAAVSNYYGGAPRLHRMIFIAQGERAALDSAANGAIHDLANWPLAGNETVFKTGQKIQGPVAATWIIGMNTSLPPLNSEKLRRSFRGAVDTEAFRLKFFSDALPAHGYVPPGLPGYRSKPEGESMNMRSGPVSDRVVRLAIPQELARHLEMKEQLESDFKKHGWKVEVVPMSWDKLMKRYDSHSHQAFLVSMNMDYPDAEFLLRAFESGSSINYSALNDSHIDALLAQARKERDRKMRQSLYAQALTRADDAAVTINLFHPVSNIWASSCVRGLQPNILSDVYIDYTRVSLDPECVRRQQRTDALAVSQ